MDRRGPRQDPVNLGGGWVGFDFAAAFGCPVKVFNDAAMQALGSYEGGRMLFLGLGTALGSTLVADRVVVPLELGRLYSSDGGTLVQRLGKEALERQGRQAWQQVLADAVAVLKEAFAADYIVLGGGNAEEVDPVPEGCRLGGNENAFVGGFRLWGTDAALTQMPDGPHEVPPPADEWRAI